MVSSCLCTGHGHLALLATFLNSSLWCTARPFLCFLCRAERFVIFCGLLFLRLADLQLASYNICCFMINFVGRMPTLLLLRHAFWLFRYTFGGLRAAFFSLCWRLSSSIFSLARLLRFRFWRRIFSMRCCSALAAPNLIVSILSARILRA